MDALCIILSSRYTILLSIPKKQSKKQARLPRGADKSRKGVSKGTQVLVRSLLLVCGHILLLFSLIDCTAWYLQRSKFRLWSVLTRWRLLLSCMSVLNPAIWSTLMVCGYIFLNATRRFFDNVGGSGKEVLRGPMGPCPYGSGLEMCAGELSKLEIDETIPIDKL